MTGVLFLGKPPTQKCSFPSVIYVFLYRNWISVPFCSVTCSIYVKTYSKNIFFSLKFISFTTLHMTLPLKFTFYSNSETPKICQMFWYWNYFFSKLFFYLQCFLVTTLDPWYSLIQIQRGSTGLLVLVSWLSNVFIRPQVSIQLALLPSTTARALFNCLF